jgi:hypothetical protein
MLIEVILFPALFIIKFWNFIWKPVYIGYSDWKQSIIFRLLKTWRRRSSNPADTIFALGRFVLYYYVSLRSEFRVVMSVTISAWKRRSVRLYLQFFLGGLVSLFTLFEFVCVEWCPTHIMMCFCFVFLRLCALWWQFPWIVHFWLPFGILSRLYIILERNISKM